jgi:hypothetical protein
MMPLLSLSKNYNFLTKVKIIVGFLLLLHTICQGAEDNCITKTDSASIKSLSWISGHWVDDPEFIQTEEFWLEPRAGLMLGLHRDILDGNKFFFEYLRIEQVDEKIIYYASPRGNKAVGFTLTDQEEFLAIFENQENEFPKRIIYKLIDDKLHVKIDGGTENDLNSLNWVWQKINN